MIRYPCVSLISIDIRDACPWRNNWNWFVLDLFLRWNIVPSHRHNNSPAFGHFFCRLWCPVLMSVTSVCHSVVCRTVLPFSSSPNHRCFHTAKLSYVFITAITVCRYRHLGSHQLNSSKHVVDSHCCQFKPIVDLLIHSVGFNWSRCLLFTLTQIDVRETALPT
jgi:hypothetical protein